MAVEAGDQADPHGGLQSEVSFACRQGPVVILAMAMVKTDGRLVRRNCAAG